MRKLLLSIFTFTICIGGAFAQTSPTPYDLVNSPYIFTQWDSSATINAAGTYPTNMMFHTIGSNTPNENSAANGNWACTYDLLVGCWVKGKGTEGVAFRNIGNSQSQACVSSLDTTSTSVYIGDATVALNTAGCENISVSWIGRMVSNFTYSDSTQNSRFYGLACQYRLGTTGAFTNVPGNYLFKCNSDSVTYKTVGTADTMTTVLPDTCNNQPIVEIRWIYHQIAANAGGPRPVLGLDEINITRDVVTAINSKSKSSKALSVYPNPVNEGKIFLSKTSVFGVYDMLGQQVGKMQQGKEFNTDALNKGIYFIKTTTGETIKFVKQ